MYTILNRLDRIEEMLSKNIAGFKKKSGTIYTIDNKFTSPVWHVLYVPIQTNPVTSPLTEQNFLSFLGIEFEAAIVDFNQYIESMQKEKYLINDKKITLRLSSVLVVLVNQTMEISYTFEVKKENGEFEEELVDVKPNSILIQSMMSKDWSMNIQLKMSEHI